MNFYLLLVLGLFFQSTCSPKIDFTTGEQQKERIKKEPIKWFFGDHSLELGVRFRLEGFYGKNTTLLNDHNGGLDQVLIPAKHTFDMAAIYGFGCQSHCYDILKIKVSARTKATWGAPESIATTEATPVKNTDVVFGSHSHVISRNIFWVREIWLEAVLNDMFGLPIGNWRHSVMAGFFPFQLGRGISLGDAYAVDPDLIGYYSANAIDQYAPGLKISGENLHSGTFSYDLYAAILNNKSNTFDNVNLRIRGQEYGHRFCQQRGFGVINWLAAVRCKWFPIKDGCNSLMFEPYALYDNQKEQRVEFIGDAQSKLGTLGLGIEGTLGDLDFGFEFARNFGHQRVRGADSNAIINQVRNGSCLVVNSDVVALASINGDMAGELALYTPANQAIINASIESQLQNGQSIGGNLQNSSDRFSDPYVNTFKGFMAVGDVSYKICDCIKLALAAGIASGDRNPNRDFDRLGDSNSNTDYRGFISLQEVYSGTRVRSAFLLSGAGKVPRLLSFPSDLVANPYPDVVTRFTNIAFVGSSAIIKAGSWNINPNILSYWQEHATRTFDRVTEAFVKASCARTWLGIEMNTFADVMLLNDIKLFVVGSIFVPGTFYKDIAGRPLNRDQQKHLNSLDNTGIKTNFVPTIGHNTAWTFNMGIEYKF